MEIIRDRDGRAVSWSRNLRGIRRYVGSHLAKVVSIDKLASGEGKLCILFENGASYETNFASFSMLCWALANWRNLYGAPLRVNGNEAGVVKNRNPWLDSGL